VDQDLRKVDPERPPRGIPLPALRAMRRSMALSQKGLAELAGVSATTVRQVENGRRGSYPSTLRKLSEALGVTPAALAQGHRPDREEHASR
jgi:transcriptional regulator with XRE-family HTH domain